MEKIRIPIAVVVTAVWAAIYGRAFADPSFHAPPEVSGVMLAVASWLFATDIRKRIANKIDPKEKNAERTP